MHRSDAYSSTSYSRGIRWLPSPEVCQLDRWVCLSCHLAGDNTKISYGHVTKIPRNGGLLSEPTAEVNGNDP